MITNSVPPLPSSISIIKNSETKYSLSTANYNYTLNQTYTLSIELKDKNLPHLKIGYIITLDLKINNYTVEVI